MRSLSTATRRFVARSDAVFPAIEAPDRSLRTTVGVTAGIVLGFVVSLGRHRHALDTLYAEDGTIFLQRAIDYRPADSIFEPYAGYVHVVPRSVAELASLFPIASASTIMSGAGALGVALIAAVVFRSTSGHVRSTPLRIVVAGAFIVLPLGQQEVFNTATNLHWFLMPAMVWMLLARPATRTDAALFGLVLFAGAASDPLTLVVAPLALYRWFALPLRRERLPLVAYAIGLGVQFVAMAVGDSERGGMSLLTNPAKLVVWFATHTVGATVFGSRWVNDLDDATSAVLAVVAVITLGVMVAFAVRALQPSDLVVPVLLVAFGMAYFAAPVILESLIRPRYSVPSSILLVSALVVLGDRLQRHSNRVAAPFGALGLLLVVTWAASYRVDVPRNASQRWSDGLDSAKAACSTDGGAATIEISPDPVWTIRVPCSDLSG